MKAPLARKAGVISETFSNWIKEPHRARKKGFDVYVSERAPHLKGGNPHLKS
jgi:hypothetical protein